ncbi:MAG: hypothetical protein AAGT88_06545 [Dethiobacter sp.]
MLIIEPMPGMIVMSHTKITGFGGTIKSLGMGCGNRGGKQMMHSSIKPKVAAGVCNGCRTCLKWVSYRSDSRT